MSFFDSIFGSGDPYRKAMEYYNDAYNKARDAQNPFYQAGTGAIGGFQDWLNSMKDPSAFINNLTNQYQQSPWARFQTDQATKAATNAASASGLMGSTPYLHEVENYAQNISNQDMNNWLQNVLGINSQYGQGQAGLMNMGQHSADILSQLASGWGNQMAEGAYGKSAADNMGFNNMFNGLFDFGSGFYNGFNQGYR